MITGIILASGFSKRMGKDKLTIEINGEKVIERVIKAAIDSKLDKIILVYRTDEIKDIGEKYKLKNIYNPNAHLGQSESVILGVKESPIQSALMFIVADQPYLNTQVMDRLIQEYNKDNEKIVVPYYNNKFGMPLIFPPRFREELLKASGDKGGREIIKDNPSLLKKVYFKEEILGIDIDRPEDLDINDKNIK